MQNDSTITLKFRFANGSLCRCNHKFYNSVTLSYGVDTLSVFPYHYGMPGALQETSYGAAIERKILAVIRDTW